MRTIITLLFLSLLSCSTQNEPSVVELIGDKLNEYTGNEYFADEEIHGNDDGYYVVHISQNKVMNNRLNYDILFQINDYLVNELNMTLTKDSLDTFYKERHFESDEAYVTTIYNYHNIGPSYHPIMLDDCEIIINLK